MSGYILKLDSKLFGSFMDQCDEIENSISSIGSAISDLEDQCRESYQEISKLRDQMSKIQDMLEMKELEGDD